MSALTEGEAVVRAALETLAESVGVSLESVSTITAEAASDPGWVQITISWMAAGPFEPRTYSRTLRIFPRDVRRDFDVVDRADGAS